MIYNLPNPPAQQPYKPKAGALNIILIVADDLGINDLSGGTGVATPNIDPIARNGVRFESAYAAQATCAPLFRGRNPTEIGFEFTPIPLRFSKIFAGK